MGRLLHDDHHHHDRRLRRGPPAVAGRARSFTVLDHPERRRARSSTPSRSSWRCSPREASSSGSSAGGATRMLDELKNISSSAASAHGGDHRARVLAAAGPLRRHRARSRAHAAGDGAGLPRGRGRRVEARKSCGASGIERARGFVAAVSTDAENVYAVLSARLLRPDLFIIGRAETDDARDEAAARRGGPRDLAVSHRRPAARADGAAPGGRRLRPARDLLGEPRSQSRAGAHRRAARRSTAGRWSRPACVSDSAWSSSASAAPTATMDFNPAPETCHARRRRSGRPRPSREAFESSKRRRRGASGRLSRDA